MAATVAAVYTSVQGDGGNSGNGVTTDLNPTGGDYLIVCLCGSANADAMTKPDVTWTEISVPDNSIATGGGAIRAYWKKNPAASTTYTWTLSSGRRSAIGLLIRGADGTTLVDVASSLQSAPGTNHTPPSVTTAGADRLIVDFAGLRQFSPDTANWTAPASGLTWTEHADVQGADSNNNIRLAAGSATAASAGAVSTAAWTQTDPNEESIIIRVAVTPAAGGATPISVGDTGAAADTVTTIGAISPADTGAATETVTVSAGATVTDAASSTAALTVSAAGSLTQTASSTETVVVSASTAIADAGSAADSLLAGIGVFPADNGTSSDTLTAVVAAAFSDAGGASQSVAVTAAAGMVEAGASTEALTCSVTVALTDAATAADSVGYGAPVALTDSGDAADALTAATGGATVTVAEYVRSSTSFGWARPGVTGSYARPSTRRAGG